MKTSHAIGLVVAAVVITIVIEESRISSLTQRIQTAEKAVVQNGALAPKVSISETPAEPVKTKSDRDRVAVSAAKNVETAEDSFANTTRKMLDNPAGKAMMNQGVKMAVGMMYQDFIDGLNLSKEEGEYFKNLLGKEMSDQQAIGMKLMGATKEERKALGEEMTKLAADSEAEIHKFLNNEEDVKAFKDYKDRLPERQQLDGIRATMTGKGVPLDSATETKLLDAMYRARTEAKGPDFSSPSAMEELAKGNIVESYEKSWDVQQEVLRGETTKFLSGDQMAAFQEYQKHAKDMQMMGLKMAEKMMPDALKEIEGIMAPPEEKVEFKAPD